MNYSIDFKDLKEFIHARITGENSETNVTQALLEVAKVCQQKDIRRVLIEASLSGPDLTDTAVFDIVNRLVTPSTLAMDRVAYVNSTPGRNISTVKFAESVAVNRGIRARVFETIDEARIWIIKP